VSRSRTSGIRRHKVCVDTCHCFGGTCCLCLHCYFRDFKYSTCETCVFAANTGLIGSPVSLDSEYGVVCRELTIECLRYQRWYVRTFKNVQKLQNLAFRFCNFICILQFLFGFCNFYFDFEILFGFCNFIWILQFYLNFAIFIWILQFLYIFKMF
jgi:hypothetical protein